MQTKTPPVYKRQPRGPRQQSGAVLVIGLIILVVLTMLGVQGMRTNVAQERMAGNMRERNLAFQAAESALRLGEAQNPVNITDLQLLPNPGDTTDGANPVEWNDGTVSVARGIGVVPSFDAAVDAPPVFHMGPPEYIRVGLTLPPEFRLIYPVTSRGTGGQPTSVVVLQSGFEPANN
jgi:type IV pilus assembly protein PilX